MDKTNDTIQQKITDLIVELGENPTREGLINTPKRFLKSMRFLTSGYDEDINSIVKDALFTETYDEMVIVKDIEFYSLCEHHLLPFFGKCHIGYLPNGYVIGLSKIPRIINAVSRRLQLQERLTHQINNILCEYLKPAGIGVIIEAQHLCVMMRGIQKQGCITITSSMSGSFRDKTTREEFMKHLSRGHHSG